MANKKIASTVPSWSDGLAETITEARTIYNSDSGKVFYLDSAGGAYAITFDAVANLRAGFHCRFVVQEDTPTGAITITAPSAIVYGNLEQKSVTNESNRVAAAGVTNVIIGTGALKGDYLDYDFDGTSLYVRGMSSVQGAVTTS